MCCCMACGPRRLAWHWPPTPQDHSGTLGAEEFKACLISLGFDIANDAQVLNHSHTPAGRCLTGFFFFFLLFPLVCLSSPYSPSIPTSTAYPSCLNFLCDFPHLAMSTLWIVASFFLNSTLCSSFTLLVIFLHYPCLSTSFFSSWFRLSIADLVEEIRNHGC